MLGTIPAGKPVVAAAAPHAGRSTPSRVTSWLTSGRICRNFQGPIALWCVCDRRARWQAPATLGPSLMTLGVITVMGGAAHEVWAR
jgi:hypothetical protein